jgi:hypothetical protein
MRNRRIQNEGLRLLRNTQNKHAYHSCDQCPLHRSSPPFPKPNRSVVTTISNAMPATKTLTVLNQCPFHGSSPFLPDNTISSTMPATKNLALISFTS